MAQMHRFELPVSSVQANMSHNNDLAR